MLKREIVVPPEHLYPPDEWRVVEARYSEEFFERAETIFSLGNGFVGIRGTFEEGRPALSPGTFINGFHETWPIVHAEEAHALARKGQTIVNVPDVSIFKLYVDDEPLFLPTARVRDYARVLDMRAGTLSGRISTGSGTGPTSGYSGGRLRCGSSRLSGGTCSRSRRRPGGPRGQASRRRG